MEEVILLTDLMNQLPYDHPARMNYKSIEIAPEKTYWINLKFITV